MAIALTAATIAVILLAANIHIISAQQPPPTNQPAVTQKLTLFQSTEDSFRVQVPRGWVIHDVNNSGFMLLTEVLQGYGVLAQFCPQEQQQALRNVGSNVDGGSSSSNNNNDNLSSKKTLFCEMRLL
jgi:hypothetical protein